MLDLQWRSSQDGAVLRLLRAIWTRVIGVVDDSFPMPPDEREERDWTPESSEAVSQRRRLRVKFMTLQQRERGGKR
jgi:hypothetical protein